MNSRRRSERQIEGSMEEISSKIFNRLFRVKKNELAMLEARGYDISAQAGLLTFTLNEFINYYSRLMEEENKSIYDLLSWRTNRLTDPPANIYVYYSPVQSGKTGKTVIEKLVTRINEMVRSGQYPGLTTIIIANEDLSSDAAATLNSLPSIHVQTFRQAELLWNVTGHVLSDIHQLLTPEQVDLLLQQNRALNLEKFPIILDSDPQAKFLGARPGQVVRILRRNIFYEGSVEASEVYRFVKSEGQVNGI